MKNVLSFILIILIPQIINSQILIPYLKNDLYGFANQNGRLIIPAQYKEVTLFGNLNQNVRNKFINDQLNFENLTNIALVNLNGRKFLIDKKGQNILENQNAIGFVSAATEAETGTNRATNTKIVKNYIKIYNSENTAWGLYNLITYQFTDFKFEDFPNPYPNRNYEADVGRADFINGYMLVKKQIINSI